MAAFVEQLTRVGVLFVARAPGGEDVALEPAKLAAFAEDPDQRWAEMYGGLARTVCGVAAHGP